METNYTKQAERAEVLLAQLSFIDRELQGILTAQMKLSEDFASPFFTDLKRILKKYPISRITYILLSTSLRNAKSG